MAGRSEIALAKFPRFWHLRIPRLNDVVPFDRIRRMRCFVGIIVCLCCAFFGCIACHADDAVGVLRINVASNGEVAVAMPFAPVGDGEPDSFLAGPFIGDGSAGSDVLHLVSAASGDVFSYSFVQDGWVALIGNWIGQWLK